MTRLMTGEVSDDPLSGLTADIEEGPIRDNICEDGLVRELDQQSCRFGGSTSISFTKLLL